MTLQYNKIPQWICITGQSGAGKNTIITLIEYFFKKKGIKYKIIRNGDIIRAYSAKNNFVSKRMGEINSTGKAQPLGVMLSLWGAALLDAIEADIYIIHDGTPRLPGEIKIMSGFVEAGYVQSLGIYEVTASDELCTIRLAKRTAEDFRPELSKDGMPGTPDPVKIATKLSWWNKNEPLIYHNAWELNIPYKKIKNNGSLDDLKTIIEKKIF